MGYEDREYLRDEQRRYGGPGGTGLNGGGGFQFDRRSMVLILIIINVVVFAIDLFSPRLSVYDMLQPQPTDLTTPVELENGQVTTVAELKNIKSDTTWFGNLLSLKTDRPWEIWAYLTHGFAHASFISETGIWHLIFNMLTLFFLGVMVEQKLGADEFLKFYLAAVLVGGIGWMLSQLLVGSEGSIVGASGAVSAVIIYFVMLAPQSTLLIMGIIPAKAWVIGVLFLVMNIMYALGSTEIAWQAHLAGAAFGFAYFRLGWNFEKVKWPQRNQSRLKVHDPDNVDQATQQEADRILAKISQHGEASLTWRERRTLNKYSKMIRKRRD